MLAKKKYKYIYIGSKLYGVLKLHKIIHINGNKYKVIRKPKNSLLRHILHNFFPFVEISFYWTLKQIDNE